MYGDEVIICNHPEVVGFEVAAASKEADDALLGLNTIGEHRVVLDDIRRKVLVYGVNVACKKGVFQRFEDQSFV